MLALVALGLSFWSVPEQRPAASATIEHIELPKHSTPAPETSSQVTESLPRPELLSARPIEPSLVTPVALPRPRAQSRRSVSSHYSAGRGQPSHLGARGEGPFLKQVRVAQAVLPPAPERKGPEPQVTRTGQMTPSTAEATLVELRLGQLAARTVQAYRVGEEALLPLTEFLNLAQLQGTVHRALAEIGDRVYTFGALEVYRIRK